MSVFVVPMVTSPYVKKEDVPRMLKARKINFIMIGIFYAIVVIILIYFIGIKANELYRNYGAGEQIMITLAPFVGIIGVALFWLYAITTVFSKHYNEKILEKANKFAPKEMIHVEEIIEQKDVWIPVGVLMLGILLTVFFYTFPIFLLSSR